MSASYEETPNVGGNDRHGGRDGDEDEEEDDSASGDHPIGKKQSTFRKAKQVVQLQFTKAKKQFRRSRSKSKSGRVVVRSPSFADTRAGSGSGTGNGCYFCFLRPQVLESPNGSPISDPNDPNFTLAMLKALIEKNDFYSKECNPHLD